MGGFVVVVVSVGSGDAVVVAVVVVVRGGLASATPTLERVHCGAVSTRIVPTPEGGRAGSHRRFEGSSCQPYPEEILGHSNS